MRSAILLAVAAIGLAAPATSAATETMLPGTAMGTVPDVDRPTLPEAERLIGQGHYQDALAMLDGLRKSRKADPDILSDMGFCLGQLNRLDDANAYFLAALTIKPDHRRALQFQGDLFLAEDKVTAAKANLERLSRACPQGCDQMESLSRALDDYAKGRR